MAMKKRSRSHSNKKKTPNNNIVKKEEEPPKASTTTTVQENRPHRSTTAAEEDNLGALEFAAALNGEDPRQVLDCLKRFVKIVQQDRRVALGEKGQHSQSHHHDHDDDDDDDDDDESSSEEENDVDDSNEEPQKKKFKASESWKEDTRDYHVPFVGTAVAKGGRDRGAVVVGQWPTGLLKAYLDKSPLAVELTGESLIPPTGQIHKSLLRNKQGKLSSAIYKAYLKALAELITAAIPVEKLSGTSATSDPNDNHKNSNNASNEKNSSSDPKYRFMSAILKERVPGILAILKEETKRGKAARAGPMTPYALQILSNLAMTSVENTRNLLRNMEQSLNEGIWRLIIRLPPQHKHNNDEREEGDGSIGKPKSNSQREVGRTAILKLAKAVLQTKDPTVFHHSSISGSKDRKVSPGILVLTLRDVCRDHFGDYDLASSSARYPPREAYYIAIAEFLQDLRDALWDPSARLLANRRWAELLSFDVLQNLCDISLHAPVLTKPGQFQTVLDINEEYGDSNSISPLQRAGLEARRLLWPLLMDPARSPFLQLLLHDKTPPTDRKGNAMEQTVVRTMCRLLDNHPSSGKLALHACLCHGMQVVPTLLPGLFQKLTVPDHTKHCFPFLARLRFISLVLRDGPSPSTSLRSNNLSSFVLEKNTDAILCTILPLCLKKNVFTKALQSKNALVVSETMKSLLRILQRLKVVRKDVKACSVDSEAEFWTRLSTKLSKFLPDLQVILSTLSRFDVLGKDPCARIVHSHLAQLLLWYASVLPELLQVAKFDWMKLLPNTSEGFNSLPPYVQLQLLRTLEAVLKLSNVAAVAPISCRLILEIMTTCKSRVIYKVAKRLCCFVLQSFTPVKVSDRETRQSVDYEITCWVECITLSDIPEFCDVLQHASELSFQSNIVFLRAWNSEGLPKPVPKLPVSSLLVAAITSENQRCSCSEGFAFLLNQVTSRCLLYHNNPLPLCALITYAQKLEVRAEYLAASPKQSSPISTTLLDYSESLVRYEQVTDKDRENRLKTLLAQYFSDESFYRRVSDALLRGKMGRDAVEKLFKNMPSEDLVAAMRLALHVFALYDGESMRHAHFPFLFQLLPVVLEVLSIFVTFLNGHSFIQFPAAHKFLLLINLTRVTKRNLICCLKISTID
mgnify:CR=1 FL=1